MTSVVDNHDGTFTISGLDVTNADVLDDDVTIIIIDEPKLNVIDATTTPDLIISLEGPPGPPGIAGTSAATVKFSVVSVSSWNQHHSFDYLPEVRLVDSDGYLVESDVEYPDSSHVAITFAQPFTGSIFLS